MSFLLLDDNGALIRTLVASNYLHPAFSFARASSGTAFDGGTLREFGNNVPRLTSAGLLLEGQRQSLIRNPRAAGAITGTPGTLPTNSGLALGAGLSQQVVAVGSVNGVPIFDLRFFGTPSSSSSGYRPEALYTAVPAANGQTWTASVSLALVGGALPAGGSAFLDLTGADASSVPVAGQTFSASIGGLITSTLQPYAVTGTYSDVSIASHRFQIRLGHVSGTPLDFTLRIALPQLELGAFASSPILPPIGTPGVTTRLADNAPAPLAALGIPPSGACTLVGRFTLTNSDGIQALWQVDSGNNANRFLLATASGTVAIRPTATLSSISTTAASQFMTLGVPFGCAVRMDGQGGIVFSVNGSAVAGISGGPTSGLTTLNLGRASGGAFQLSGPIHTFRVLPRVVSDAELQSLSLAA